MADSTTTQGGTSAQHAAAGHQSHKNDDTSTHTSPQTAAPTAHTDEGRGWHGDPEGHAEAARKGQAHHEAASRHEAAAHSHRQAASTHEKGDEDTARAHATEAHSHSSRAHESSTQAHEHSHNRGGTHEQHVAAGHLSSGNKGNHEQHVEAGRKGGQH